MALGRATGKAGKLAAAALLVLSLFASAAFALSGATPTLSTNSRWSGASAAQMYTEGGNISAVNVASVSLTDRWAAFYGNVSGSIALTSDGSTNVYSWSWSAAGGKVCASTGATIAGANASTTGAAIDTAWSFGSVADNAANTYATPLCNMTFSTATVTNTANVSHKTSSSFTSCALTFGGTAKTNYFFCTAINSTGKAFNNETVNYELMVPTAAGASAETYYFYAELS